MSSNSAGIAHGAGAWMTLSRLVAAEGAGSHGFVASLIRPDAPATTRDLADAVHHLCMLHGRQPGVIDHASLRTTHQAARGWLGEAAEQFSGERALLAQLVSAAGPLPSTPGQAETEAAVVAQRHALDMLAQSDRSGSALGTAFALVLEWRQIRRVLDVAGHRLGVPPRPLALPPEQETAAVVSAFADRAGVERALAFGAQQLLAQHRGLWDLLEARASARSRA